MKILVSAHAIIYSCKKYQEIVDETLFRRLATTHFNESSLSDYLHDGNEEVLHTIEAKSGTIYFELMNNDRLKVLTEYESYSKLNN